MKVDFLDKNKANEMLVRWHYLGKVRGIISAIGNEEGVLVFTNLRSRKLETKCRQAEIVPVELARMVAKPEHKWFMSQLISNSFRLLKMQYDYDVVVTYSDPFAGHDGTVYKAANFIDTGNIVKDGHPIFIIDGESVSPRTLYDRIGTSSVSKVCEHYADRVKVIKKPSKRRWIYTLNRLARDRIKAFFLRE